MFSTGPIGFLAIRAHEVHNSYYNVLCDPKMLVQASDGPNGLLYSFSHPPGKPKSQVACVAQSGLCMITRAVG